MTNPSWWPEEGALGGLTFAEWRVMTEQLLAAYKAGEAWAIDEIALRAVSLSLTPDLFVLKLRLMMEEA